MLNQPAIGGTPMAMENPHLLAVPIWNRNPLRRLLVHAGLLVARGVFIISSAGGIGEVDRFPGSFVKSRRELEQPIGHGRFVALGCFYLFKMVMLQSYVSLPFS